MSTNKSKRIALLKAIVARSPLILKTALLHGIRMSPVSGKQDLRTELTVALIRSFISPRMPVSKQQKASMIDLGTSGSQWVSNVTLPQPENDVQEAVMKVIEYLKPASETYSINLPGIAPVEAEWIGYRSGVDKTTPQPDISEEERYTKLRKEASTDTVILYFHGGAYFLMDPCTHRIPLAVLSRETGASILSVRYRLAPQHPFPAALVDALVAYLSLIAPPAGSFHDPIPANRIIFSGDSAGGNLCLALLETLLTLRRISPTIRFHGREIPIELPAGLAMISPWCDVTISMPSVSRNARFDYLSPLTQILEASYGPDPSPIPEDDIWPSNPPRGSFFVNAPALLHPLVSPLAAQKEIWKDAPPIFICIGEEGVADEGILLARKIHQAGVPVVIEQFQGMPHVFGFMFMKTPAGRRCFKGIADFCRDAVAGQVPSSGNLTLIEFKLRSTREIPLDQAVALTDEEADQLMRNTANWRMKLERELQRKWTERAKL